MEPSGTLSIVATPIGNLEDITLRAIRTLSESDYILCEDTRVTGKLLKHHGIISRLKRYDVHASEFVHETVIADLLAGKKIALVSDAGTPGVSDPGVHLVARVRNSVPDARIDAIPGPSAITAAFSIAGLAGNQFSFLGFIPQKKGRQTFLIKLATYDHPVIFFESTHRICKLLAALAEQYPTATVYLARELTKLHEEMRIGTPTALLEQLEANPVKQKGEFVVIITLS